MKNCAVITAAGRSSRMGAFKPALPVAGRPALLHLIDKLFSAGVSHIIVVVGFKQDLLRDLLAGEKNITIVNNPDFQNTQMFDSAKIGLRSLPDDSESVLLIPVDHPFVREETIRNVLNTDGDLVFPSYHMRRGHPLKISREFIPDLLNYSGQDGLRGFLRSLCIAPVYVVVEDQFIICDMDTPEDYQKLLQAYQNQEVNQNDDAALHVELP